MAGSYLTTSSFSEWEEAALLGVKRPVSSSRTWGDGYGYALVATGRVDTMVDGEAALYDLAPMPVILGSRRAILGVFGACRRPTVATRLATNGREYANL